MTQANLLVKRRTFLKAGVVAAGAVVTGAVLYNKYKPRSRIIARQLISYLQSQHLADKIGASYIASNAALHQLSLDQLIDLALEDVNLIRIDFSLFKSNSQLDRFQKQVRQNFIDENIVLVDGWVLSVTEAHLCAVLHRYLNPLS